MSLCATDGLHSRVVAMIRRPSGFALLVLLVWLLTCARLLHSYWDSTAMVFPDTDDAMRLAQWRDFIDGRGWFDLHQPRLSPPQGYESHWSRLIDAGLAGLYFFFRLFINSRFFTDDPLAEALMRAIWPLLWIVSAMTGVVAIAWRLVGVPAAIVALLLMLAGGDAYRPFLPGTIDHHNVQIALTMLVAAATIWSDRVSWSASVAGFLTALSLAIGLEALPYLAVCGAAVALRFVVSDAGAQSARRYSLSFMAGLVMVFVVTVAPGQWLSVQCDALAINLLAAILPAAALLVVATLVGQSKALRRLIWVALAVFVAAAAGLSIEPRCVLGPYALVDPRIWPIWLSWVFENQSLAKILASNPFRVIPALAFPAGCLVAMVLLLHDERRRNFATLTVCAAFLMAWLTVGIAIRAIPYAIWFGFPVMAAAIAILLPIERGSVVWRPFVTALLLSPFVLGSAATLAAPAATLARINSGGEPSRACRSFANVRELSALPPGLIVTDVFHGAHILALTPHSVLAAPYHRLSEGTVLAHRILAGSPDEARDVVRQAGVTYIALCGPRPPDGLSEEQRKQGLWAYLEAGAVPDWLDPIATTIGRPFTVYRVLP